VARKVLIGVVNNMAKSFDIIIATHENLCEGLINACQLISGIKLKNVYALSFKKNMETSNFESELDKIITTKCKENDLLILADIIGGTPTNIAIKQMNKNKYVEIISGINLQLLLQIIINRDEGMELTDINIDDLISESRQGLMSVNKKLKDFC
jgi:mannose PTS system EIIA component